MSDSLPDYQKYIYKKESEIKEWEDAKKRNNKRLEIAVKKGNNSDIKKHTKRLNEISKKVKIDRDAKIKKEDAIDDRHSKLLNMLTDLQESISIAGNNPNPGKQETQQVNKWRERTSRIADEITEYNQIIDAHEQGVLEKQQQKLEKQTRTYKKERNILFSSAKQLIRKPKDLNDILLPFSEDKGVIEQSSVDAGDVITSVFEVAAFAVKNAGSLGSIVSSIGFYQKEAKKIPNKDSFFIKLLNDPDTPSFLEDISPSIGGLLDATAPTITSIAFRELGNLENAQKKLNKKPDNIALQNRVELAKTLAALKDVGIDSAYVNKKLLPVLIGPVKEVLQDAENIVSLAKSAIDLTQAESKTEFSQPSKDIASKFPIKEILKGSDVSKFLIEEKETLATIVNTSIANNKFLKEQADKFKISEKLISDLVPAIADLAGNSMADQGVIQELYHEASDILLQKELDTQKLLPLINKAVAMVGRPPLSDSISNLGENIINNQNEFQIVAKNALNKLPAIQKQLSKLGIDHEPLANAVPIITKMAGATMQHSPELSKAYINAMDLIVVYNNQKTPLTKEQEKSVSETISSLSNIVDDTNFKSAFNEDLPSYVQNNKDQITNSISNLANNTPALKGTLDKNDVTPETLKIITKSGLDILASSMPVMHELASSTLKDPDSLTNLLSEVQKFLSEAKEAQTPNRIISSIIELQNENPDIFKTLEKGIPSILMDNRKQLTNITSEIVKLPALSKLGVPPEEATKLVSNAVPLVARVAEGVLGNTDKILILAKEAATLGKISNELTRNQRDSIEYMVDASNELLNDYTIRTIIRQDLPNFIKENKQEISKVALGLIENNSKLKDTIDKFGITPHLLEETINVGADLIASALPTAHKILDSVTQNPKEVADLTENIMSLMDAPNKKNTDKLLDTFFDLQDKSPQLKEALMRDLPNLIDEHSENLASLLDKHLSTTKIGKALNLESKEVLDVVARKLPRIMKLAEHYKKGNFGGMIKEASKIIFDRKVLGLVVSSAFKYRKLKKTKQPASLKDVVIEVTQKQSLDDIASATKDVTQKFKEPKKEALKIGKNIKGHVSTDTPRIIINKDASKEKGI